MGKYQDEELNGTHDVISQHEVVALRDMAMNLLARAPCLQAFKISSRSAFS